MPHTVKWTCQCNDQWADKMRFFLHSSKKFKKHRLTVLMTSSMTIWMNSLGLRISPHTVTETFPLSDWNIVWLECRSPPNRFAWQRAYMFDLSDFFKISNNRIIKTLILENCGNVLGGFDCCRTRPTLQRVHIKNCCSIDNRDISSLLRRNRIEDFALTNSYLEEFVGRRTWKNCPFKLTTIWPNWMLISQMEPQTIWRLYRLICWLIWFNWLLEWQAVVKCWNVMHLLRHWVVSQHWKSSENLNTVGSGSQSGDSDECGSHCAAELIGCESEYCFGRVFAGNEFAIAQCKVVFI